MTVKTRGQLFTQINSKLKRSKLPELKLTPLTLLSLPLRVEIEELMEEATQKSGKTVEARNTDRREAVQEYLQHNWPDTPIVSKILLDLDSYRGWNT
ncbi:MAG: hypothetical protein ACRD8W_00480 [Nitrososphaeraceae archaeon]